MNYKVLLIAIVIAAAAGAALERQFAPKPVSEVTTHIVYKDKIVTIEHTVVAPDGTKTTDSTTTKDITGAKNETASIVQPLPKYMLGAGYSPGGTYEATAAYRVVGPVWAGLSYNTKNEAFVTVQVQF